MKLSRIRIHGPLTTYLEGFWKDLRARGYTPLSCRNLALVFAHLSRWMAQKKLGIPDLDVDRIESFRKHRKRQGYTGHVKRNSLKPVLRYLIEIGVVVSRGNGEHAKSEVDLLLVPYLQYLKHERGLAATTMSAYEKFVRLFLTGRFGRGGVDFGGLTATDACQFVLRESRKGKSGHLKYKVTALRSFLRYLYVQGEISENLASAVPAVAGWRLSSLPKALSEKDIDRLLRSCDRRKHAGRREFAALLLMVRLGLRAGEVTALEFEHIHWLQGEIEVMGKGGQVDRLPLPDDVGKALASYLRHGRPRINSRKIFLRVKAPLGELGVSGIKQIVRTAGVRAGLGQVGAHRLRHSAATAMLRGGSSLSEIAQVLRHRSLDTTAIYAKVDRRSLRQVVVPWPVEAI